MSNYKTYAMREFRAAGWVDEYGEFKDQIQKDMCSQVLELLALFDTHGHSGFSAPYAVKLFTDLAMFEPLVPITGEDWEFMEVGNGVYQNIRCSHVFKQADRFNGQAYDIDGRIFWEWYQSDDGEMSKSHFTNSESCVPIVFPYTPKKEYVFRPTAAFPNENLNQTIDGKFIA